MFVKKLFHSFLLSAACCLSTAVADRCTNQTEEMKIALPGDHSSSSEATVPFVISLFTVRSITKTDVASAASQLVLMEPTKGTEYWNVALEEPFFLRSLLPLLWM